MIRRTLSLTIAALLLATGVASAALTPLQKCEISKLNATKAKYACLTAQRKKVIAGQMPNTAACEIAFSNAFARAETAAANAGGSCLVTGDAATIEQRMDAIEAGTAQLLAGEGRFHDNGDGTIADAATGLVWEKKSHDGSLHDVDNEYTWFGSGTSADGTLFTTFLAGLNASGGFAGHSDWRIPTIAELETIIDYSVNSPSVSTAFDSNCAPTCSVTTCSCTAENGYWSSSLSVSPGPPWFAAFNGGVVNVDDGGNLGRARGVRAGL